VAEGRTLVTGVQPGVSAAVTVQRDGKRPLTIVVLTPEQSQQLKVVQLAGQRRLVLSAQQVYTCDHALQLRSTGSGKFRFAVYPALGGQPKASIDSAMWSAKATGSAPSANVALHAAGNEGIFQAFEAELPTRELKATLTQTRAAQAAPPVMIGGLAKAALQPIPEAFKAAASWQVNVPREQLLGLHDALLQIDFVGDIGRLYSGTRLLDDWYYSGYQWQFGLRQNTALLDQPLTVSVLPLRADAPVYLPKEARPDFGGDKQIATVRGVSVIPVYQLRVAP
jgi:hypothetical protein